MPTGYTSVLYDGEQSLRDYAFRCARGIDYLFALRDQSLDAGLPHEIKRSTYYDDKLTDARAELDRILDLSDEEANSEAEKEYKELVRANQEANDISLARKYRYGMMARDVKAWEPPAALKSLKKFMLDQLEESSSDCATYNYEIKRLTAAQYKTKKVENILKDIEYYSNHILDEKERISETNRWLKILHKAFDE